MEIAKLIAQVCAFLITAVGVAVTIYVLRYRPRIAFRICQLADYGVDRRFFPEITACPVFIKVRNVGGGVAHNVQVQARLSTPLLRQAANSSNNEEIKVQWTEGTGPNRTTETTYTWSVGRVPPEGEFNILLRFDTWVCQRPLNLDQVRVYLDEGRSRHIKSI